jgi:PAS domain S-box-containing protein
VMSEITAHKQLEASLRESEERFRVLTEHSLDTIMLFDRELRHLYVNPVVKKGLGIPAAEFIGKTHSEMGFPAHLVRLWEGALQGVFASGNPDEIEFQLPNGIWADWLLAPVHGPDGSVDQVLASARVITKLKMTEETLRRANRQVNLLNEITRHDILNQITVIRGYLALAEKKQPGPERESYFSRLMSAAETIQDQIEFTRIYEDIGSCEPQWQDVAAVLALQPVPAGITLTTDLLPSEIFADPMLGKVFFNLLDNAARHGCSVRTVRVSAQEEPDRYVIMLEDNGSGIVDTDKEKIFERGFGKNTGLGLFLVREILAITGITIRETGTAGTGARFEIAVPRGAFRFPNRVA